MLTDKRDAFIKFAEIPEDETKQVLAAYNLTKEDAVPTWVIAFCDGDNGAYVTTWSGDDYTGNILYEDAEHSDGQNAAKACALGYALATKGY